MKKKKQAEKLLQNQNDFLVRKLEMQNESIQYTLEALIENYSVNYMMINIIWENNRKIKKEADKKEL